MQTKCPICGYSLDGLPARHSCPECGFDYDKSMTPFDGLHKPLLIPNHLCLLLFILTVPASIVLIWTDTKHGVSYAMILTSFVMPPSIMALLRWKRPETCPRLILLGDSGLVVLPDRGEPYRFGWLEIQYAKQSWVRGGLNILDANGQSIAYLSFRYFKSSRDLRRLVEQIKDHVEQERQRD